MAARAGRPTGFLFFLRVGVLVTLASPVLATAYAALALRPSYSPR